MHHRKKSRAIKCNIQTSPWEVSVHRSPDFYRRSGGLYACLLTIPPVRHTPHPLIDQQSKNQVVCPALKMSVSIDDRVTLALTILEEHFGDIVKVISIYDF